MRKKQILAILVLTLGLMVWLVGSAGAAPLDTAFSYQGRLIDANAVADGLYDLQFKLFDDPNIVICNQIGEDVNVPDIDVIDGYFTVYLDFNDVNAFNGDVRWLQIGVRPGDMNDPNIYTVLSPRQELTPTPYAIYAQTSGGVIGAIGGGGTTNYIAKFTDPNTIGDSVIRQSGTEIGIGTMYPKNKLDVEGAVAVGSSYAGSNTAPANGMIVEGNVGIGTSIPSQELHVNGNTYVSDNVGIGVVEANGNLHVHDPSYYSSEIRLSHINTGTAGLFGAIVSLFNDDFRVLNKEPGKLQLGVNNRFDLTINTNGDVGIGTTSPEAKLDVNGQVKITGGSPGAGKVLTSNATGLASWQTPTAGDITAVNVGTGLIGGGTSGDVTLDVNVPLVLIRSVASPGAIIKGINSSSGVGVWGESNFGYGVYGKSSSSTGVHGHSSSNTGVYGYSSSGMGVYGQSPSDRGVVGRSSSGWAGYFDGPKNYFSGKVGIGTDSPDYKLQVDGDVCPESHKRSDLGKKGLAWDDIYYDDLHNEGAAAFTDRKVTEEILQHPPMAKKPGMFDYMTERGLEELDPDSLPEDLRDDFDLLTDEMTTYNYKANYEQQLQIKKLQAENEALKKRLEALERKMEQFKFAVAKEVQL